MYQTWDELEAACMGCQKCGLCSGRTNLVFGVGNKKAKIPRIIQSAVIA